MTHKFLRPRCGMTAFGLFVVLTVAGCASQTVKSAEAAAPRQTPAADTSTGGDAMKTELQAGVSNATFHAIRLVPGDDLRKKLAAYVQSRGIQAAAIVSAVGSLHEASLRMADQPGPTKLTGKYEIVSLSGTLSPDGPHLHIALSDQEGHTIGGHVLEGCMVYTTAEVVIAELTDLRFSREPDPRTGYDELQVEPAQERTP
jgi:uncharacterized protein